MGSRELIEKYKKDNPNIENEIKKEKSNCRAALLVFKMRKAAKLTQKELAERLNTNQSAISRLEDADYDGHTMSMLDRVAEATGRRIRIQAEATRPDQSQQFITL